MTKKTHLLIGAIFGGLFMLPVLVLAYWGQTTAELPFPPFDLFNIVPTIMTGPFLGGILTFGIDTLVNVITTFELGRLDEAAKIGEQILAVVMVFGSAAIAAGGFTAIMNRVVKTRQEAIPRHCLGWHHRPAFYLGVIGEQPDSASRPLDGDRLGRRALPHLGCGCQLVLPCLHFSSTWGDVQRANNAR